MNADPGSLENLHDLVMPVPVPWWPPAPGWVIVSAALIMVLGWWLIHAIRHWRSNSYRREALVLLGKIDNGGAELPFLSNASPSRPIRANVSPRSPGNSGWPFLIKPDTPTHSPLVPGAGLRGSLTNQHWPPRFRRLNLTARGLLFAPGFCGISPKKLLRDYPGSSMAARAAAAAVAGESPASALSRIPERADCTVP